MRLIDADALTQKAVETFYITNYFSHITKMIDDAPTVKPEETQWIPVTERLPENDVDVIVTGVYMGHNYVEIASCSDGRWSSYMDEYKVHPTLHKIIAWMPLPEPYKGVD